MEALELRTVDDLIESADERVELIDGELVRRPMARFEHARVQSALSDEILPLKRAGGPDGWWIISEVSVRYNEHQCPSHDLAGWRKERVPERPSGIMTLPPDWVCELLSPGHERKDLVHHLLMLQRFAVPHYWIISPEDRTLIAYALERGAYRVCYALAYDPLEPPERARIRPFEAIEIDLGYLFGEG
jgi:Uma2 family endonuclease